MAFGSVYEFFALKFYRKHFDRVSGNYKCFLIFFSLDLANSCIARLIASSFMITPF